MPVRRKRSKAQGSTEGWDLVNASNCTPKESAVVKQDPGLDVCSEVDYSETDMKSIDSTSIRKNSQPVKRSAKASGILYLTPADEKQASAVNEHKELWEDETQTFEWVNKEEELEENYELIEKSNIPVSPGSMSFTELSAPLFPERRGLVSQEPNLEKVLAEACKDQCLSEKEFSVPPNEAISPSDESSLLPETPEEKTCDTQQKKKRNRKKKAATVKSAPMVPKTLELPLDLEEPAPLFSEILSHPKAPSPVLDVPKPIEVPVTEEPVPPEPIVEPSIETVLEPVIEPKLVEISCETTENTSKPKMKKRKRCLNANLADSFSDHEPVQEVPKVNEWITPKPLKPSKNVLKESNEIKSDTSVKTETRQKKRSKSNKSKSEPKAAVTEIITPKENVKVKQPESNKMKPVRNKTKQKGAKKPTQEPKKVARTHGAEEENETWPILWFRNRLDIFGLRRK